MLCMSYYSKKNLNSVRNPGGLEDSRRLEVPGGEQAEASARLPMRGIRRETHGMKIQRQEAVC